MSNTPSSLLTDLGAVVARREGTEWCLFVDRDGVVNRRIEHDYVRSWTHFEPLPGVDHALRLLAAWAPHVVVVTNQQGIGKGLMTEQDVEEIHARFSRTPGGSVIEEFLVCPHLESSGCACRKPGTGLAKDWLAHHADCDPSLSMVVGDAETDMEMAVRLAAETGGADAVKIGPATTLTTLRFDSLVDFALAVEQVREDR